MRKLRKKNTWFILGVLILLLILISAFFFMRSRGRGTRIILTADTQADLPEDFYENYYQNDPGWAKDRLGISIDTMEKSGCLTSCIAASLTLQGSDMGTPGQLNQLFSSSDVYLENGSILWSRLSEALPNTTVILDAELSSSSVNELLEDGFYPIVKVRRKSGAYHWVTITEANAAEESFICLDPLEGKTTLSEYNNEVYAIRIITVQ